MDNYFATMLRLNRHTRENDIDSIHRDIQILVKNFKNEFEKKASELFYELIEGKTILACFALFANEYTRPLYYGKK